MKRSKPLKAKESTTRAWMRRGAERYEERVREQGGRRPLERRGELATMSEKRRREIEASGKPMPSSSLKQKPPKRRDHDVVTKADRDDWHELVCRSRWCVKGCGRRAGPHGHHAIEKSWLLSNMLLASHAWDFDLGVAVCEPCHSRHTSRFDPITRAELIEAGYWQTLVQWAREMDARYFPGAHPVEARLERDYPEVPTC